MLALLKTAKCPSTVGTNSQSVTRAVKRTAATTSGRFGRTSDRILAADMTMVVRLRMAHVRVSHGETRRTRTRCERRCAASVGRVGRDRFGAGRGRRLVEVTGGGLLAGLTVGGMLLRADRLERTVEFRRRSLMVAFDERAGRRTERLLGVPRQIERRQVDGRRSLALDAMLLGHLERESVGQQFVGECLLVRRLLA